MRGHRQGPLTPPTPLCAQPRGAGRKTADLGVESSSHGPTMPRRFLLELDGFRHGAARPDYEYTS
jgi:hypothetical protein